MEFLYPDGFPGWGVEHAAMFETAILLHIAPELVMMDRAVDDGPKQCTFYDVLPIEDRFTTKRAAASGKPLWRRRKKESESGRNC